MTFVRRISLLSISALLVAGIGTPLARCQNVPATDSNTELNDIKTRLANVTVQLNQTRADLDDARAEIREMHKLLEEVRARLVPAPVAAPSPESQTSASATEPAGPSTEAKLQDIENRQDLAATQQAQINQVKVESASKYRVKVSGMVLFNAFSNRGNSNDQDLPEWAEPPVAGRMPSNIGATLRQTLLGLEGSGPALLGARTSGQVYFDFYGGFPNASYGITAGLVRLRTGDIRMDWERTSIIAGQDKPFLSPLSPTSLASVGDPALAYAGNLWTWVPQVWVEHRFHDKDQSGFSLQGGLIDPISYTPPQNQSNPMPSAGEQSRQPAYAARISWQNSAEISRAVFGVGGYFGKLQYANPAQTVINAWAATADWQFPLTRHLDISGELYRGQSVGSLGGGLFDNVVFNGSTSATSNAIAGVNSAGGWTQLKWHATRKLEWNLGAGQDNPFAYDLKRFYVAGSQTYLAWNRVSFANFIYHAKSNLLFSVEYRHTQTRQLTGAPNSNDHVNLAAGYLF